MTEAYVRLTRHTTCRSGNDLEAFCCLFVSLILFVGNLFLTNFGQIAAHLPVDNRQADKAAVGLYTPCSAVQPVCP